METFYLMSRRPTYYGQKLSGENRLPTLLFFFLISYSILACRTKRKCFYEGGDTYARSLNNISTN